MHIIIGKQPFNFDIKFHEVEYIDRRVGFKKLGLCYS